VRAEAKASRSPSSSCSPHGCEFIFITFLFFNSAQLAFLLPIHFVSQLFLTLSRSLFTFTVKTCNGSNEQISPAKWKSMEEEGFHASNNHNKLSTPSNVQQQQQPTNADKISTYANDNNNLAIAAAAATSSSSCSAAVGSKNIESIDEEIIVAANPVNDDFYGVV